MVEELCLLYPDIWDMPSENAAHSHYCVNSKKWKEGLKEPGE